MLDDQHAECVAADDPGSAADMCALTVGSLFSGIGGIDLGLERAGMKVIWQAETDPYASRVLAKHWPELPNLGDVKLIDWSSVERPDVIAGGFPCQPVSSAGRRLAQADERWLWPEYVRAVRDLRPRYVLVENVPGLTVHAMGDVLGDLAALGYDAEWEGIPAAAVGAPHLRWRIFIVAHAQGERDQEQPEGTDTAALVGAGIGASGGTRRRDPASGVRVVGRAPACGASKGGAEHRRDVADPSSGRGPDDDVRPGRDAAGRSGTALGDADSTSSNPHAEAGRSWGPVGESGWWAVEPDVGRVAHGIPSRVDRLRCLGNAVVPQVAEYVGQQIIAAHNAQEAAA